jgi:hypothetical protein
MLVGATCWAAGLDLNINEKLRGTASNKLREEGKDYRQMALCPCQPVGEGDLKTRWILRFLNIPWLGIGLLHKC